MEVKRPEREVNRCSLCLLSRMSEVIPPLSYIARKETILPAPVAPMFCEYEKSTLI